MNNEPGGCCRYKAQPRDEKTVRALKNRLNRIIGQLSGIGNMLDDNRYCGDIITQLTAAESALQSLGYVILTEHIETCVTEKLREGDPTVIGETVELIKKLK